MLLFFQTNDVSQLYSDASVQIFVSALENVLLLFIVAVVLFLIVSAPLFLLYSTSDNWRRIKKYRLIIDKNICCEGSKTHTSYEQKVCSKYVRNYASFFGNLSGISVWIISSFLYIQTQFTDALSGVISYFEFPFTVLESIDFNNVFSSLAAYKSSWFFMMGVLVITALSYLVARYLFTRYYIKVISKRVPNYLAPSILEM